MQQLVSNNISYSLLKAFDEEGPRALIHRKMVKNAGTDFGTKLDDFISLDRDEFNKKYLVVQNNIKGDLLLLAEKVANSHINFDEDESVNSQKIIKMIVEENLFKTVTKDETRLKKFDNTEFYDFVNLLRTYKDKSFITPEEYSKLVDCRTSLYSHRSTAKYFNCGDDCEELYQVEVNFQYKGRNIKTILDKIIINHGDQTIQGIDLKSGSVGATDFMKNFFTYKYYIQGALYNRALTEYVKKDELAEYTVLPFKYIFIPTFDIQNPKTFILTDKWIRAAVEGFKTNSGYKYRGIDELIDLINWHIDKQVFNESKEFYENDEVFLDDNFIHLEE